MRSRVHKVRSPVNRIRYFAVVSVRRAVGFGLLAIGMVTAACSHDPTLAVRVLAVLLTIEALVLYHCALNAGRVPYRRREIWLLLDGNAGLHESRIQPVIDQIMAETFRAFAHRLAGPAAAAWVFDLGNRLFG